MNIRWLIILCVNLLVYFLVQELNDALTFFGLNIYLASLYIVFPAIYLAPTQGAIVVLITSWVVDAPLPTPFGTTALLSIFIYTLILLIRHRIRHHMGAFILSITFFTNLILFLILTLIASNSPLADFAYWQTLGINLICSQAVLLLAAPWVLELEQTLFQLSGTPIREH
ncbi:MAG TPA: hypothetical protein DIU37_05310 [Opitutae bacterium]|nr:hypothetical protein [Opitutae bacterium]